MGFLKKLVIRILKKMAHEAINVSIDVAINEVKELDIGDTIAKYLRQRMNLPEYLANEIATEINNIVDNELEQRRGQIKKEIIKRLGL